MGVLAEQWEPALKNSPHNLRALQFTVGVQCYNINMQQNGCITYHNVHMDGACIQKGDNVKWDGLSIKHNEGDELS